MSYAKETPQQHRKNMIALMDRMLQDYLKTQQSVSIQDFKKLFMCNTGASKFKTDEYFDLVMWMHSKEYEINEFTVTKKPEQTANPNPEQPKGSC